MTSLDLIGPDQFVGALSWLALNLDGFNQVYYSCQSYLVGAFRRYLAVLSFESRQNFPPEEPFLCIVVYIAAVDLFNSISFMFGL